MLRCSGAGLRQQPGCVFGGLSTPIDAKPQRAAALHVAASLCAADAVAWHGCVETRMWSLHYVNEECAVPSDEHRAGEPRQFLPVIVANAEAGALMRDRGGVARLRCNAAGRL